MFPPSHQAKSEQSYNHTTSSGLDFPGRGWRGLEVPLPSSPHPAQSQTKPKCKIQTVLLKVLGYERQRFNGEIFCWKVKQSVVCGRSPSPNITTQASRFANTWVLLAVIGKAQQGKFQLLHRDHTLLADSEH